MKTSYVWVFWLTLSLSVITAVTLLVLITDMSLFKEMPVIYLTSMATVSAGLSLLMQHHHSLPLIGKIRLQGSLVIAPLMLLMLSVPAAIIYIYYDLNGKETLKLMSDLFASLAAVFFLTSLSIFTLTSLATVYHLFSKVNGQRRMPRRSKITAIITVIVLSAFLIVLKLLSGYNISGVVLLLPLFALALLILDIVIFVDFRNSLTLKMSGEVTETSSDSGHDKEASPVTGFRSVLLFPGHYLNLISGKLDYLINRADASYAEEILRVAGETFDPALVSALRIIASGQQFGDAMRHEAASVSATIEKYYSDPLRYNDLLRLPGISDKAAAARTILAGRREPQTSEVLKLLSDTSPEIRRIGLAAAGRYMMKELCEEAIQALYSPDTKKEAFYLLIHFGPDTYGSMIGSALRTHKDESISIMVMRLLHMMPLPDAMPYLINLLSNGSVSVKLLAAKYLCCERFVRDAQHIQSRLEESINETIYNIARLIAIQTEVQRRRYFFLSRALQWEKSINYELLFHLVKLMAGPAVTTMIRNHADEETPYGAGIAAEIIDAVVRGSSRQPLKALLGNHSDSGRIAELAACYPLRGVTGRSIITMILSSEQNITGEWTKACALHKVAAGGSGADKDLVLSYLFSNSILLQEEAARVIRALKPDWFHEAESRLPERVRQRAAAVINSTIPVVSMIFEKTRFLSLCFNKIPEERMILLASGMRYSESYDAGSLAGVITWIVPSEKGKSGLYALPVSDITNFIFHYSEYTDIFVDYIDRQGGDTV